MMRMQDIPPAHRLIEAVTVGLFFGDANQLKCPSDDWTSFEGAARFVSEKSKNFIGFRRFVYDPEYGKKYMDPGWVYFRGKKISRNDVLSGKAEQYNPDFKPTDVLKSNVKYNDFDVIWFKDFGGKSYPFNKEDVFVEI
jgi:hypothetical protein